MGRKRVGFGGVGAERRLGREPRDHKLAHRGFGHHHFGYRHTTARGCLEQVGSHQERGGESVRGGVGGIITILVVIILIIVVLRLLGVI